MKILRLSICMLLLLALTGTANAGIEQELCDQNPLTCRVVGSVIAGIIVGLVLGLLNLLYNRLIKKKTQKRPEAKKAPSTHKEGKINVLCPDCGSVVDVTEEVTKTGTKGAIFQGKTVCNNRACGDKIKYFAKFFDEQGWRAFNKKQWKLYEKEKKNEK